MPVGERGLLEPSELWPQEQQLCAKAAEGSLLDLRARHPDEDDPVQGRGWGAHRNIRAQVVFQLLTGHGPVLAASVVAVRLRGVQIVGRLNLGGWKLCCPLELNQCHLRHRLDLAKAEVPNISLRGSYLQSPLSGRRMQVAQTFNLTRFRCDGGVVLEEANISGRLICSEGVFSNPNGYAVKASQLVVGADMALDKAQCTGEVRLVGAHVGGQLNCSEGVFSNPNGYAVNADRLVVGADMFLRKAQCTGEVRLLGAHISGQLGCEEGVFSNLNGDAVNADGLVVDTYMFLRKAQCTGVVWLLGAHIGGQLICSEGVFSNPNGDAVNAYGLVVGADMLLDKAQCTGKVRLLGAHIGGQLICNEGVFSNPNDYAVNADGLVVDTNMFLRKAQCTGEVRLLGAHISGQLICNEGVFSNPNGYAVNANQLVVGADMALDKAQCTGEVRLIGAQIRGQLNCSEAVFSNPDGLAINLERASVEHNVCMRPASLTGGLDLRHAQVGGWNDEKKTWPSRIYLEGFVYDSIDAPDAGLKDRLLLWLPRNSYLPHPYEQLAGVYRREGNEQGARKVSIGKQRARRADFPKWWVRWPSQTWSAVLRWTIGYGYRPALALIPLAVLILAGSVLFLVASDDLGQLRPAKTGPEQPSFNSFRYTMDLLLPVVNFKQRDAFVAEGWAAWAAFGFTFAGWLLAAVVVAGLSGVFKRD
jgi:predicted membrane protein